MNMYVINPFNLSMNKAIFLVMCLFLSNVVFAQKSVICADGACSTNFAPRDQFEKIYYSGIDAGEDNEDDLTIVGSGVQAPRSVRVFIDNKNNFIKNANINLTSGSEFFNAPDAMLIGNRFNNISMILNGYSGILGKSASQICAEKYQLGGTQGYGNIARAEFQAKRIDDPSLPVNRCVFSDVEYLQNNTFTCDAEDFTPIDSINPTVSVRRYMGKNKCLGVSFNDVCLQRSVEVTCNWKLQFVEPAGLASQTTIFNDWVRFTNNNFYANRAAASGEAATFILSSGSIRNTTNSSTAIGFVSPDALEYYTAEGVMTSSDDDDDSIGVIVAFRRSGTRNYTLTALRSTNGTSSLAGWSLIYNIGQPDSRTLDSKSFGTSYSNDLSGNGWSGKTVRFKSERDGDVFKVWASDWNSPTILTSTLLSININDVPELEVFRNGGGIGWMSQSQVGSNVTYSSIEGVNLTGLSTRPEENITKKFYMSEGEYNYKKTRGLAKYLCNNLATTDGNFEGAETLSNGAFARDLRNWTTEGNTYWVNNKVKLPRGPHVAINTDNRFVAGNDSVYTLTFKYSIVNSLKFNPVEATNVFTNSKIECNPEDPLDNCYLRIPLSQFPSGGEFTEELMRFRLKDEINGVENLVGVYIEGFIGETKSISTSVYNRPRCKNSGNNRGNSSTVVDLVNADGAFVYGTCGTSNSCTSNRDNRIVRTHHFCVEGACLLTPEQGLNRLLPETIYVSYSRASSDINHRSNGRSCFRNGVQAFRMTYNYKDLSFRLVVRKIEPVANKIKQTFATNPGRRYRITGQLVSATEEAVATGGRLRVYNNFVDDENLLLEKEYLEPINLTYPLTTRRIENIDLIFAAQGSSGVLELSMLEDSDFSKMYPAYFDNLSIKEIPLNAGPPVRPTDPPIANVIGLDGLPGYYTLIGQPVSIRTTPGYDVENLATLPDSKWKLIYTPIGGECPEFSEKIRQNYLASAITYDENDNACDDVGVPEDPQGIISWRNVGFERKEEFGTEVLSCSPGNCSVDFTLEDKNRSLDVIDTSDGISGTSQGQGVILIYDANTITTSASTGSAGSAGANDLPDFNESKMCARVQDAIYTGTSGADFATAPQVQFRRYKWKALEVTGTDAIPVIPADNRKRVHIIKKIDSSIRYLLKQELL